MKKIKFKKWKIIIIFIIFFLQYFFKFIKFTIKRFRLNNEFIKNENYLKLCSDNKTDYPKKFKISKKPKISIISPLYNTGKYILRLLKSIQYQKFINIEIILIDDCSKDNSVELIKTLQRTDKRIQLIRNKINKGTFASRNIGILKSKGKYIILPDSDDILLENILYYFYHLPIKSHFDFIRYNVYITYGQTFFGHITDHLESRPIYQPELSTYIFYGLGFLNQVDFNICNKFIKREALIRALNMLEKINLNIYMTCHEDGLLNYLLYRTAKSSFFIKKFGYYYLKKNDKRKTEYYNFNNIKFSFIHLMNVFNYSKNNQYERDMTNNIFNRLIYEKKINDYLSLLNKEYNFFIDIIVKVQKAAFILCY